MSRAFVVIKREFTEMVKTRSFIIATLLGPLLIVGFFALQVFILTQGSGGGRHTLVIADATGEDVGQLTARLLEMEAADGGVRRDPTTSYEVTVEAVTPEEWSTREAALRERVIAEEISGFLYLAPDIVSGETPARYLGSNATNATVTSNLRAAVQSAVQTTRLSRAGIDPDQVGPALRPVRIDANKLDARGTTGSAEAAIFIGIMMAFAIYMAVMLYGAAVMNGVLEEKRDKIVELILSSVRARDLLIGKVLGIGGAGMVQMAVWVLVAAFMLSYGAALVGFMDVDPAAVQQVQETPLLDIMPASAAPIFLVFFAAGFLIFSTLYAALGAVTNTPQEAQQFVFPVIMPLLVGVLIAMSGAQNPDSTMVMIASIFPLTSPLVMPVRAVVTSVPILELTLSILLAFATAGLIVWMSAKIYRIGILSSGKRPTFAQLARWVRSS
ncbi:MAG: ABC transporter permease [Candidatus Cloacimonetes bacterium]|jgi:ABC-2 type transport system permease protein|nr:ABC transporter permease [Candidatus Cloacimonadota bacterium]